MRPALRFLCATLAASLILLAPAAMRAEEASTEAAAANPPAPAGAASDSAPAISVVTVTRRPLSDRIFASGLVAAVEEVQVQPLIEGQPIEELRADIGDMVAEGQVLAVLSRATLELQQSQSAAALAAGRATVAQAEAQLVEAEATAADAARTTERTRLLRQQGAASQAAADTAAANAVAATARVSVARQSLEAARAQVALYEAQLANVALLLARTEVKAPHAGRVTARNATLGAIASAMGAPMFVLERDGALELRADVAAGDLARLAPGMAVEITAEGLSGPLAGTVRLIEPAIDAQTRLGRVRIALGDGSGPAGALRAGQFAEATIIAARSTLPAVPATALASDDGHTTALRVRDGRVEAVTVTPGIREDGWVGIADGLAEGDLVVSKAGAFVRPGDRITPVPDAMTN